MATVVTDVDRPDRALVDRFAGVPAAILSDVTPTNRTMDHGITPAYPEAEAVGTAVTVHVAAPDNLLVHKALTLAEPGDVIVVDAGGYAEGAIWGDLMSTSAAAQSLAGTVVDGAIRDRTDIASLRYPVYSRHVSPKSVGKAHAGTINRPVTCGGVVVSPGDIVVGDGEGVVAIDPSEAEAVLSAAESKVDAEAETRTRAESGEYLYDIAGMAEAYGALDVDEV